MHKIDEDQYDTSLGNIALTLLFMDVVTFSLGFYLRGI
jgi:hypothetical protein